MKRCKWAGAGEMLKYHDKEWGKPLHNDRKLFELLCLEGAQAGLSWSTVLKKRKAYKKAFLNFDPEKVARFDKRKIKNLLQNEEIIRNRLKIRSAIENARAFLKVKKEFGSFDKYIWSFSGGKPVINKWKSIKQIPARTELSDIISKELKKRGFSFIGSTICYAYMQGMGMVNDHTIDCYRYREIKMSL